MAHWAELDNDSKVIRVIVTSNEEPDEGYQWLVNRLGGNWVKTSYNTLGGVHKLGGTPLRKNYAGIGFTYDQQRDAFIPPKPEPKEGLDGKFYDWNLDEETCQWVWDNPTLLETINESPYA